MELIASTTIRSATTVFVFYLPSRGPADGGGAPKHKPQRVTKDAPVSVRTQIKYAKMKKSMERNNGPKKMVHNKYRRVKNTDYEDVREGEL